MDDFELEVTDLDADISEGASDPPAGDEAAPPGWILTAASSQAPVPDGGSPIAGQPRPALRRYLVAVATMSVCLLVALVLIVSASPAESAVIGRLFPTPTPLPIGAGTLILDHYAPWGQLTVNGQATLVGQLSEPLGSSQAVPKLILSPGRYTLDYRAAPFPPLRCQISVPFARSDTCPLMHPRTSDPVQGFGAARVLDLRAEIDRLPSSQLAALTTAIQRALQPTPASATLLPGEAYLAADGTVAVAHEQLIGTFLETLNHEAASAILMDTGPCLTLCMESSDLDLVSWSVEANVVLGWRYTTPDAQVVIPSAPAVPTIWGDAKPKQNTLIALEVRWSGGRCASGGWQVILLHAQDANPICAMLSTALVSVPNSPPYQTFPGSTPAQGCAFNPFIFGVNGIKVPAYFLYQFGVVLAANAEAHRFFPSLPLADARQQALAQQLMAQAGGA